MKKMKSIPIRFPMVIFLFLVSLIFIGCPKKKLPVPITPTQPTTEIPTETATVEEPTIRGGEFVSIPELKVIKFNYDKYDLTDEAKKILEQNTKYLSEHPEYEILAEGHCCECGSSEYNLALGQKRAMIMREYYVSLGILPEKIATLSYGEEKPIHKNVGPPDSPLCSENRRGETKVRVKKQ